MEQSKLHVISKSSILKGMCMFIFYTSESAYTYTNILTIWSNQDDSYACNFLSIYHVYNLTQC